MASTPLDLTSPFTTGEFRAAGQDTRRLRTQEFRRVLRDTYVLAAVHPSHLLRVRAALKVAGPRSHASHHTAAELWDLAPPRQRDVHVSAPEGVTRSRTDGIRAHRAAHGAGVVVRHGVPVSSPVQTFLDLAGVPGMPLVDLAVVADRVLSKGLATAADLVAAAEACRGHGARLARRVARLARAGVDSPMETRLRLLIVLAGLPEPKVNHVLRHDDGSWWLRLDLSYPDQRVLVEYDGRQHAESTRQWRRDIQRRELLERSGWRTVTVTAEGVFGDPEDTLRRVEVVLRERRVPGLPRRLGEGWRMHFAARD